jgi:DNA-binding Lrp family transcriptional regulator
MRSAWEGPMTPSDDLDRSIVQLLSEDGRLPGLEISRRLGVSEKTIRLRIAKLTQNGMRVVAMLRPEERQTRMLFFIHTEPGRRFDVAARLSSSENVDHVYLTTGAYDMVVEAAFSTDAEALEFLVREVEGGEGIRATQLSHLIKEFSMQDMGGTPEVVGSSPDDSLSRFVQSAAKTTTDDELLCMGADAALRGNRADRVMVSTYDFSSRDLRMILNCSRRLSPEYVEAVVQRVNSHEATGLVKRVLETKLHVYVEDAPNDPLMRGLGDLIEREGYRSLICLPMFYGPDMLGTLTLYYNEIHHLAEDDISLAQAFADQIGVAVMRLHEGGTPRGARPAERSHSSRLGRSGSNAEAPSAERTMGLGAQPTFKGPAE